MNTQDRLRLQVCEALRDAGMSQAAAARSLGITPKHMSQMMTGRARLTLEWAEKIVGLCGLAIETTLVVTERDSAKLTYKALCEGWDE